MMTSTATCPLRAGDTPPPTADPAEFRVPSAGCLLCGARFEAVVWRENGYEGRGTPCGLVYLEPRPAEGAVQPQAELHGDGYYARNAALRMDFIQRFAPGGRLLEVGCGAGYLLAEARRRGYEVSGVEPSAACVEHVRQAYGIPVEQAIVEETRLPEGAYDVVFHVDLLSHFPDPVRALRAMAARVRPGGFVCFEVGILGGMSPRWYAMAGRLDFPEHRWLFSETALRELLRRAGLEVVDVHRYGLLASVLLLGVRQLAAPVLGRWAPRPAKDARTIGEGTSALARLYGWLQHLTRYRMGRWMPRVGPLTLLVAARPAEGGAARG
jgi:SAM-dependent methyltransferase